MENLLIKRCLEDAKINGNLSRKMEVQLSHHKKILRQLLKKKLKLRESLRNLNGIMITGTCSEIKIMIRFKQLSKVTLTHKLRHNKRLNHLLLDQLIPQILWKKRKLELKKEMLNNSLKLKPHSKLNSTKLTNLKLQLTNKKLSLIKFKPMLKPKMPKNKLLI
jgi:hypothetical protein